MTIDPETQITRILQMVESQGGESTDKLLPLVYDQLRDLARANLNKERPGQTLQPTALVHEAYLRVRGNSSGWNSRGHFFGAAARAMRRILVEQARRKARLKHGGGRDRVPLAEGVLAINPQLENVLVVEEALKELEALDPRKGEIVNLRYFAGLSLEETAQVLEVSLTTVEREWRFIKSWLILRLTEAEGD